MLKHKELTRRREARVGRSRNEAIRWRISVGREESILSSGLSGLADWWPDYGRRGKRWSAETRAAKSKEKMSVAVRKVRGT